MESLQVILDVFAAIAPWNIILGIITVLVTGSLAFVFGWFSLRYASAAIFDAMMTGKLHLSIDQIMSYRKKSKIFSKWYWSENDKAIDRRISKNKNKFGS